MVWEVVDEQGVRGAMKFLHKSHFEQPGKRLARFKDEIEFLRRESGRRGILPLLDANLPEQPDADNRPWLVTPLARTFSSLSLAGVSKLPELVAKIEGIARVLSALHDEGKYHRDLKPENLLDLDGKPLIGDFGLVDYPGKEAVTESSEILGPMFYLAPEMMADAADLPSGPADVYSLAKTLWVLASGQQYPLPGEMRVNTRALRLSTYCPHPRASMLDLLLERCTQHDAARRPTMLVFADELAAWLKEPDSAPLKVDIEALAREHADVFEVSKRAEQERTELLREADGVLKSFEPALERIAFELSRITNLDPSVGYTDDLPPKIHYILTMGKPRCLSRATLQAEIGSGDIHRVRLQSFVQVEAIENDTIRIVAGHLVRYEVGASQQTVDMKSPWSMEATALRGSAQLENETAVLYRGLLENIPGAIEMFAQQLKAVQ